MLKKILLPLLFLTSSAFAEEGAIPAAREHIHAIIHHINGTWRQVEEKLQYAQVVQLIPGHELLKDRYGLAPAGARATGAEVTGAKLVEALSKVETDKSPEKLNELLETLSYEKVDAPVGKFITKSTDPVDTPDGKLHFFIQEGDVLLKISPPKGDFLLLQLRTNGGIWAVVAEYID